MKLIKMATARLRDMVTYSDDVLAVGAGCD